MIPNKKYLSSRRKPGPTGRRAPSVRLSPVSPWILAFAGMIRILLNKNRQLNGRKSCVNLIAVSRARTKGATAKDVCARQPLSRARAKLLSTDFGDINCKPAIRQYADDCARSEAWSSGRGDCSRASGQSSASFCHDGTFWFMLHLESAPRMQITMPCSKAPPLARHLQVSPAIAAAGAQSPRTSNAMRPVMPMDHRLSQRGASGKRLR